MCRNGVSWIYRLEKSFAWESGHGVERDAFFFDRDGRLRLLVESTGRLTVTSGYAWNGCSPKICLLDLVIGTPDGVVHVSTGRPKTYYASLIHDALYQFLDDGLPFERRAADRFFLQLMRESDFRPRWIYWLAVRVFGGLSRKVTKALRRTSGRRRHPADYLGGGGDIFG